MSDIEISAGPQKHQSEQAPDATGHTHESHCLNCGTVLAGEFCAACGQHAHVHRTLGAFFHDLLHGVFHFEGKVWRTLPMLAWRPGELTRRYVEGERAKFVSPVALFLFGIFLMFAVFNSFGGAFQINSTPQERIEALQRQSMRADVLRQEADALRRRRDGLAAAGQPTAGVDIQIAELSRQRQELDAARPAAMRPNGQQAVEFDLSDARIDTGWHWLDHALEKWTKNPALMLYKLGSNAYKFSWMLIPLSVPLLALLFVGGRRRNRLYDHTVFVTYSISFMTFLLVALSLLRVAGMPEDGVLVGLVLIVPVHMFRQLKGAYQLGWPGALWRTLVLVLFAAVTFLLFLLLLFALGGL